MVQRSRKDPGDSPVSWRKIREIDPRVVSFSPSFYCNGSTDSHSFVPALEALSVTPKQIKALGMQLKHHPSRVIVGVKTT